LWPALWCCWPWPGCCPRFRGDAVSTQLVDTTEPSEEAIFSSRNLLVYVPGVLLLIAVGLLGKYAQVG